MFMFKVLASFGKCLLFMFKSSWKSYDYEVMLSNFFLAIIL